MSETISYRDPSRSIDEASRIWAFLAYLLLVVGWLLVLLLRGSDPFARFHANQSLKLTLALIAMPLVGGLILYVLLMIPQVGGFIAALFASILVAGAIAGLWAWIAGMVNAIRGKYANIPFFSNWFWK